MALLIRVILLERCESKREREEMIGGGIGLKMIGGGIGLKKF